MIQKLRKKFVLIIMGLVSVVLVAVLCAVYLFVSGSLRQEGYRALEMALDRRHGDKGPSYQIGGKPPQDFRMQPIFVIEVDASGQAALVQADRVEVSEDNMQSIADAVLASGDMEGTLSAFDLRYVQRSQNGTIRIALMPLSSEKQQLRGVFLVTLAAVSGAFLLFLAASILLARRVLAPVEEAWERQKRFVADASHELKTPLTVILANLQILKAHRSDSIETQMTWVDNTQAEAEQMKGLVDDLLFLARTDDTQARPVMATVSLSDIVQTTALTFDSVAFEKGVNIETDVAPGLAVQGNEVLLRRLTGILLDNAIKYAFEEGTVLVRLLERQGMAELRVENPGEPIEPEALRHLFDRFYRADTARSTDGYGLGLSIAKAIAEEHDGKIGVVSGPNATVFTVKLPL